MDLTGHHSNPSEPLKALLEAGSEWRGGRDRASSVSRSGQADASELSIGSTHRRHGWVLEAVIRVLELHQRPMQAREVHAAVEALLGEPVRWASVKACLAANVTGSSARFRRVGPGRYAMVGPCL